MAPRLTTRKRKKLQRNISAPALDHLAVISAEQLASHRFDVDESLSQISAGTHDENDTVQAEYQTLLHLNELTSTDAMSFTKDEAIGNNALLQSKARQRYAEYVESQVQDDDIMIRPTKRSRHRPRIDWYDDDDIESSSSSVSRNFRHMLHQISVLQSDLANFVKQTPKRNPNNNYDEMERIHQETMRLQTAVEAILGNFHLFDPTPTTTQSTLLQIHQILKHLKQHLHQPPPIESISYYLSPAIDQVWVQSRIFAEENIRNKLSFWKYQALELKSNISALLQGPSYNHDRISTNSTLAVPSSSAQNNTHIGSVKAGSLTSNKRAFPAEHGKQLPTLPSSNLSTHKKQQSSMLNVSQLETTNQDRTKEVLQRALDFVSTLYMCDMSNDSSPHGYAKQQSVVSKSIETIRTKWHELEMQRLQDLATRLTTIEFANSYSHQHDANTQYDYEMRNSHPNPSRAAVNNDVHQATSSKSKISHAQQAAVSDVALTDARETEYNIDSSNRANTEATGKYKSSGLSKKQNIKKIKPSSQHTSILNSVAQQVTPPTTITEKGIDKRTSQRKENVKAVPKTSKSLLKRTKVATAPQGNSSNSNWLLSTENSSLPKSVKSDEHVKIISTKPPQIKSQPSVRGLITADTASPNSEWVDNRSNRSSSSSQSSGCQICHRNDSYDSLLLCDNDCGREFHTFCLTPRLDKIPSGDWYCPQCLEDEGLETSESNRIYKCSAQRCDKITGAKYCTYHRCNHPGCLNRIKAGGFCRRHEFERQKPKKLKNKSIDNDDSLSPTLEGDSKIRADLNKTTSSPGSNIQSNATGSKGTHEIKKALEFSTGQIKSKVPPLYRPLYYPPPPSG